MPRVRSELLDRMRAEGYVPVPEAARLTEVGERTLRSWTRAKKRRFRIRKIGGLVFVDLASLQDAIAPIEPTEGAL